MAKLEDYRERDKIRDAELALMKEKLSIVISSFEAEKAKIIAEYTLKFHENKTKLAEHEYALASLKTSYDESQRARLYNEDRKNEIQDDLMVTMRENDILKANNEELQETVVELYEDTKFLRKTLQNASAKFAVRPTLILLVIADSSVQADRSFESPRVKCV